MKYTSILFVVELCNDLKERCDFSTNGMFAFG